VVPDVSNVQGALIFNNKFFLDCMTLKIKAV
jgi:hypothetical protein